MKLENKVFNMASVKVWHISFSKKLSVISNNFWYNLSSQNVKSVTKTSFKMMQIITRKDELISEALVHLVFVNNLGKPIKMPVQIYENFIPYFCDSIKI